MGKHNHHHHHHNSNNRRAGHGHGRGQANASNNQAYNQGQAYILQGLTYPNPLAAGHAQSPGYQQTAYGFPQQHQQQQSQPAFVSSPYVPHQPRPPEADYRQSQISPQHDTLQEELDVMSVAAQGSQTSMYSGAGEIQGKSNAPSWNTQLASYYPRASPSQGSQATFPDQTSASTPVVDPRLQSYGPGATAAQYPPPYPSSEATSYPVSDMLRPTAADTTTLDGVTNRSDISVLQACSVCHKECRDPRSLTRHMKEQHEAAEAFYVCACEKKTKRCHNHTRHMKSCKKRELSWGKYVCRCGEEMDYNDHISHIDRCGKGTPGRRSHRMWDGFGSHRNDDGAM